MCGYPSGSVVSWYLIPSCTFVCLGVCRGGGDNLKLMGTIAAAAAATSVHACSSGCNIRFVQYPKEDMWRSAGTERVLLSFRTSHREL